MDFFSLGAPAGCAAHGPPIGCQLPAPGLATDDDHRGRQAPPGAPLGSLVVRRAVLFDFGGVILTSPFEAFARFERDRNLPEGFLRKVNSTNADTNAWARLERGQLDVEGFRTAFADESAHLGHRVDGAEVLALLGGDVRPIMVEALRRLRAAGGFVTGLLTNNFIGGGGDGDGAGGVQLPTAWVEVLGMFDVVVESSRVGVRKPDPRFYEVACAELAIDPNEAVFLDDLGVNLKPAKAMGMATIKVVDPLEALIELSAVVGLDLVGPVGPVDQLPASGQ